jgi:hypothetical protein
VWAELDVMLSGERGHRRDVSVEHLKINHQRRRI